MPFDIGALGQQAAGGVIGGALGLALGSINDDRQYNQQQRLQALQIQGQKEMTDYNRQSQLAMWNATGPQAQMKQLESAGLNPALMYGGGGPGGQTASVSPGSVSGAEAPKGGGEAIAGAQMGMALQLQQAQVKVLETQAQLNTATAEKTAGVDTAQTQATTELTQQQHDNARLAFDSAQLDITMKNILNYEQQASQGDRLTYISNQAKQAVNQSQIIANQRKISDSTLKDQIQIIQQDAIGSVLSNSAKKVGIEVSKEQIKTMANQILLNWDTLSNEQKKTRLQENTLQGIYKDTDQQYFENVIKSIDAISILKGKGTVIANP